MSSFHWFLPTNGDGRHVANVVAAAGVARRVLTRPASLAYLGQIARAAEQSGFDAVLTPTGAACEDAWITTAALLPLTERLRFLVAFRPGFLLPTLAAQQAASFQRLSGGRLAVNIVTGGDPAEQRAYGDTLGHDERYARTDEFLDVFRSSVGSGRRSTTTAATTTSTGGGFPSLAADRPPVYFGGASPAAEAVAARHADVYLAWGEPVPALVERLTRVRAAAALLGRSPRFGVRLHVITRDTADEAWAEADRLLAGMDPAARAAAQARFGTMESVGQARMTELTRGLGTPRARPAGRARTCGPASGCCAKAPGPRWSGATTTSPTGWPSWPTSGSTSSSCPAGRTSRRRTGWARRCCRGSPHAGPRPMPLLSSDLSPRRVARGAGSGGAARAAPPTTTTPRGAPATSRRPRRPSR